MAAAGWPVQLCSSFHSGGKVIRPQALLPGVGMVSGVSGGVSSLNQSSGITISHGIGACFGYTS